MENVEPRPATGRSLQVIVSNRRRGAEVFAVDLATELSRRGLEVPLVALTGSDDASVLAVRPLGRRPYGPRTLRALRREARDVGSVVAHGSKTLPACALGLAATGLPLVYRSIGDPRAWSSHGLRRWRTTALLRRARRVTVLWPGAADALVAQHGVRVDRIRVVPNGVPASRFPLVDESGRQAARVRLGLTDGTSTVAYVGALTPEKNVGTAVAAVAELPDVSLLVAGDGPERAALGEYADRRAPGRVRFLGTVPDSGLVLAACDVIVLASRTEGMPGVLIEAGLSGVPAVATDVGAVAAIVADGETGVLVPAGDVAALTTGLRRVLSDSAAMGIAARERCLARFEIGIVGASWAQLLEELA